MKKAVESLMVANEEKVPEQINLRVVSQRVICFFLWDFFCPEPHVVMDITHVAGSQD